MKVELELDGEQLQLLDKGLKECLTSLTDEQKVVLLQGYINTQLEGFRELKSNGYYNSNYVYTDFGKQVVDGLRSSVEKAIVKEMLEQENVRQEIEKVKKEVLPKLTRLVEEGIVKLVVERVFVNPHDLEGIISESIYKERARRANG